jgi:hypothetical protein
LWTREGPGPLWGSSGDGRHLGCSGTSAHADRGGEEGAPAQPTPLTRRSGTGMGQSSRPLRNGPAATSVGGGNDGSACHSGDRVGRRVRPGSRVASAPRERRRPAGTLVRSGPRSGVRERRGEATESTAPSGGGGHRVVVSEPEELRPPQLDSASSVSIGARTDGSGNRVSVKRCRRVRGRATGTGLATRHRPPRRLRRDGRCEHVERKANARGSTSGTSQVRKNTGPPLAGARVTSQG